MGCPSLQLSILGLQQKGGAKGGVGAGVGGDVGSHGGGSFGQLSISSLQQSGWPPPAM